MLSNYRVKFYDGGPLAVCSLVQIHQLVISGDDASYLSIYRFIFPRSIITCITKKINKINNQLK